jgi:hypothetical protein
MMIRGPFIPIAWRKLPGPSSLRFVTKNTLPPLPPPVLAPKPSAPGKAGRKSLAYARDPGIEETRIIISVFIRCPVVILAIFGKSILKNLHKIAGSQRAYSNDTIIRGK